MSDIEVLQDALRKIKRASEELGREIIDAALDALIDEIVARQAIDRAVVLSPEQRAELVTAVRRRVWIEIGLTPEGP